MLGVAALLTLAACAGGSTVAVHKEAPQAPPAAGKAAAALPPPGPTAPLIKIGLLLPLTGNGANTGAEMLNAAQMALFDLGEDRFQLLPRDTKGSPDLAADDARHLINDGAQLILGPLFSPEVAAVTPVAQGSGINVLAFTTDWQRAGNGTFVMGLVPADQVARVIGYAQMRGVTRLAVLAPRDAYGDAVVAAARDNAQRSGVALVREERYGADQADLAGAVARLAGGGGGGASRSVASDAQKRALAARTDEASRAALARLQAQDSQSRSVGGGGGFDALLIAQGGERLRTVLSLLAAQRIDSTKVRLLGTGLWDEAAIAKQPALAGAWYAAPNPQTRADFESRFETLYRHRPQRLASLAYDATAVAAVLARSPAAVKFDATALTNPNGFAGLDGIFRLHGDGSVQRGLAVLEISPDGPRIIDDAPASFEALTN
jgi:ABC-type branched-subunit amino acid transport system substrate-binding protein